MIFDIIIGNCKKKYKSWSKKHSVEDRSPEDSHPPTFRYWTAWSKPTACTFMAFPVACACWRSSKPYFERNRRRLRMSIAFTTNRPDCVIQYQRVRDALARSEEYHTWRGNQARRFFLLWTNATMRDPCCRKELVKQASASNERSKANDTANTEKTRMGRHTL